VFPPLSVEPPLPVVPPDTLPPVPCEVIPPLLEQPDAIRSDKAGPRTDPKDDTLRSSRDDFIKRSFVTTVNDGCPFDGSKA
jgi:hypothetical protein